VLNRPIQQLELPADALVISVIRQDHAMLPTADTIFQVGDTAIALVTADKEHELRNVFAESHV
jgi:Trk K+ transport system NAD-binding subunit